jgi:hypothetical protein
MVKSAKLGIAIVTRAINIAIVIKTSMRVKPVILNVESDIISRPLAKLDMLLVIAVNFLFTSF